MSLFDILAQENTERFWNISVLGRRTIDFIRNKSDTRENNAADQVQFIQCSLSHYIIGQSLFNFMSSSRNTAGIVSVQLHAHIIVYTCLNYYMHLLLCCMVSKASNDFLLHQAANRKYPCLS